MIGREDLETEAGQAELEENRQAVKRFIISKGHYEDADEMTQEVMVRVTEKIITEDLAATQGFFIGVAKYVCLEFSRLRANNFNRFEAPDIDDESGGEKPLDSDAQTANFKSNKIRGAVNECLMECFNELSIEEQILLWRYSYKPEKHELDEEEPPSFLDFFATILESLREIRDKFLPFQKDFEPLTDADRTRIHRLRRGLKICLSKCLSKKSKRV